ncbi:hypothetical protein EDB89DRAFT_1850765, partial [Lactarius sanguifluus]
LDLLISAIFHCHWHLMTGPIFGPPAMAEENPTLIDPLSGNYHSKKKVTYTLVPAIG